MGNYESFNANTHVQLTAEVELSASGAAGTAPAYSNLLLACGTDLTTVSSTSNTYAPKATADSSTIYYFVDGQRHKILGARGSFSISLSVSEIPTITFTMVGLYSAPGTSANLTPSYSNQATPVIPNKTNTTAFQLHTFAGAMQSFSFDLNNDVAYRELIGGTKEVLFTDRKPSGSISIEAPVLSTKDFFAISEAGTLGNLTFQHGQTAGNKVTFTMTKTDLQAPSYSDDNGVTMLNMDYLATPTTAGNDEFSLKFH
tara:strand:+ start:959 stop:1729 length:771 start_codon:yes stop_codon:yes gene_type:complete